MKLLLDLGNSRAKWAWLDGAVLRDPGGVAHGGEAVDPVLDAIRVSGHQPDEILIASVAAPFLTTGIVDALAGDFRAPVRLAESERAAAGVCNGYLEPHQLGVDRWLAMLAAYSCYRTAVCVVDAGTATTIDVVAADGGHQGGLIIPGPDLMHAALLRETGGIASAIKGLASPATGAEPGFWGRDTENCIRRGAILANACLIEGCMKALRGTGMADATLVLTGGNAGMLRDTLAIPAEVRSLLVLEGLALRLGGPAH